MHCNFVDVVQVDCTERTDEEVRVKFTVADTGIGMPADFIPVLFAPYAQSKLSAVREHGGTGLGLSIAKRMIELMQGKLEVRSMVSYCAALSFFFMLS